MNEDTEEIRVCYECIGDDFLKKEVRSKGKQAVCSYCEKELETITIKSLAEQVHAIIEEHFSLTSDQPSPLEYAMSKESDWDWERAGDPVDQIIAEIANLEEEIAKDIQEHLSAQFGYPTIEYWEEDPYGDDAQYEKRKIDDWQFRESWSFFCREIKTRSRFFSRYAQNALKEIFGDLHKSSTFEGKPVIRVIDPSTKDRVVYRARVSFTQRDLEKILTSPVEELGPPPSRHAKAGRMNAQGISVFYGAMDANTCIAEVRAPVGSHVVLGQFEIIKPVRVLDFDMLNKIYVSGSYFDLEFSTRLGRNAFLRHLVSEIARPVMPADEEVEYLPTQAVSEFLAESFEPRIDGIVFHSIQTDGEGRNLVLFNHASVVEKYSLPEGTKIDINWGWVDKDDFDDSITVFERSPSQPTNITTPLDPPAPAPMIPMNLDPLPDISDENDEDNLSIFEPTLRLDVKKIEVHAIKAIRYEHPQRMVDRNRWSQDEHTDF